MVTVRDAAGVADKVTIRALGATTLRVVAPARVRTGTAVRVVVAGLAPRERAVVKLGGQKKAGQANRKGRFVTAVKVRVKPGKARIVARGQFAHRSGTKAVRVVR